jgi:hypothetical protein
MISGSNKKSFISAHYDWVLAAVSALILVGGIVFFYGTLGSDPELAAEAAQSDLNRLFPSECGVKGADLTLFNSAIRATRKPMTVEVPEEGKGSFLSSESRVKCIVADCALAIPTGSKACPFCGKEQVTDKKVVYDTDGDGMPDEWEKKFNLNTNDKADADADLDGDGFSNIEEFNAKTDPSDNNSHPDYLDSLKVILPLDETYLPFVFKKANKIPSGWRLEFFDPKQKNDYGLVGRTITAKIGEEIGKTGYKAVEYTPMSVKQVISGTGKLTKLVDISEAIVERVSDGKRITLVVQSGKGWKLTPVDVQATLTYERGTSVTRKVVPGETIDLNGCKFKVLSIKPEGKGAKVTFVNTANGVSRTLSALE